MDKDAMPYDAEIIQRLIDEEKITVEALARKSGLSPKSIYKYLCGDRTLPSDVLRAAFELTRDLRIINLIAGSAPIVTTFVSVSIERKASGTVPIPPLEQCMRTGLESVESLAASLRHLSAIVADGKVDQADAADIAQLQKCASEAQGKIALILAAVESHRQRGAA